MKRFSIGIAVVCLVVLGMVAHAQEGTVQKGGTVNLGVSLANAWTLEFEGEFDAVKLGRWTAKRYVYDGGDNTSLDLFENGCVRLSRGDIYFVSATTGKIRNPDGEKDHYAIVKNYEGRHLLRIAYDPGQKRCQVSVDGKLAGDYALRIKKTGTIGRLSCVGFSGTVRVLKGGTVTGGAGSGTAGTLDGVLGGGGTGSGADATTLTAANPGTRTFVASEAGTLSVTAKLSTRNPAELAVTIASAKGETRQWLKWRRAGDADPSPLSVDGQANAGSMFEREPGDASPRETTVETKLQKGDTVTLSLTGEFGDGTPLLRYEFKKD